MINLPADPMHDRPPASTAETLQHDLQSVYGKLLHAERGAWDQSAERAYHFAGLLVAELLWPGAA